VGKYHLPGFLAPPPFATRLSQRQDRLVQARRWSFFPPIPCSRLTFKEILDLQFFSSPFFNSPRVATYDLVTSPHLFFFFPFSPLDKRDYGHHALSITPFLVFPEMRSQPSPRSNCPTLFGRPTIFSFFFFFSISQHLMRLRTNNKAVPFLSRLLPFFFFPVAYAAFLLMPGYIEGTVGSTGRFNLFFCFFSFADEYSKEERRRHVSPFFFSLFPIRA